MKLLKTFKTYGYSNQIGPGVYDIHSPRVPSEQEIKDRLKDMLGILPESLLFVNPVRHVPCPQFDLCCLSPGLGT